MAQTEHGLILFEDAHLVVVNKPAGVNTHVPGPYAGEGVFDWLRHREPRWASLAIIHRLDKETSGVMAFSKTALANHSLTGQFTGRQVDKKYLLLTDRPVKQSELIAKSALVRTGAKYVSRPAHAGGQMAETRFRIVNSSTGITLVEARPRTGRTHQIRVHAADHGFPILGDTLYGGSPASRLCLHSAELTIAHPATGKPTTFTAPVNFDACTPFALRSAFIDSRETNACRFSHGAADGFPGWYVDRLGDYLLSQSEKPLTAPREKVLSNWLAEFSLRGAYHKILQRQIHACAANAASPQLVLGEPAPERFVISENSLKFELSFTEGCSVGLFLDQRDNRRRLLTGHVAAGFPLRESRIADRQSPMEILNTFAYTCGFSVAAAKAGARVTSLDLSKKYLAWGERNFLLNDLNPEQHDFIYGDVFEWLRRLARKHRCFDIVVLDPPTFSRSKAGRTFQVEKNYGELVAAALPLLKPEGILFASTNSAKIEPEMFLKILERSIGSSGRRILRQHYAPQPPDFPVCREEPAYLKTVWFKLS
jgi:23S rRNA (cytosine1962-C5)-methyltransferase